MSFVRKSPSATTRPRTVEAIGHGWEIEAKVPQDLRLVTVDTAPHKGADMTFRKARTLNWVRMLLPLDAASAGNVSVSLAVVASAPALLQAVFLLCDVDGKLRRIGEAMKLAAAPNNNLSGQLEVGAAHLAAADAIFLCLELAPERGWLGIVHLDVRRSGPFQPIEPEKEGRLASLQRLNEATDSPYYPALAALLDAPSLTKFAADLDGLIAYDMRRRGLPAKSGGPLVSVVMPVFNRATLVGDAIRSVLAQSHARLELLVCDDASTDKSIAAIQAIGDARLHLLSHRTNRGAAAARNTALAQAKGKYVAYLDSDNLWHPRFLEAAVEALEANEGRTACIAPFFDVEIRPEGPHLRRVARRRFQFELQTADPYVDLNSFVHRLELVSAFGGFDERLERRQDFDLISRYAWLRDPVELDIAFNLYRRIPGVGQITVEKKDDLASPALIARKIETHYRSGLSAQFPPWVKKVSVLSWDMSRNHFAKAYSVAEALSAVAEVELISFRFFEEEIFAPYAGRSAPFETKYFPGGDFPDFFGPFARALNAISGDLIYAVKPRLPSLGLALMDNFHRGTPIMLEANDLETVVSSPTAGDVHALKPLSSILDGGAEARSPHHLLWSQVLDPLVAEIPVVFTHNRNLDAHYSRRCLYMRNIKNGAEYAPETLDRAAIRRELGYEEGDRIILFGGLVRRHKGIYELLTLLERLGDRRYKLLFVGSRDTPDLRDLLKRDLGASVKFMTAQAPEMMARINFASDLVLLWLDPAVPASHYQMPYKLTDAMAMGPAIIASPISDLPQLEDAGALWTVPFGDFERLVAKVKAIFADPRERSARARRARQIFDREFTYGAAVANVAHGAHRLSEARTTYDVSIRFAEAFGAFKARFGRDPA